jgi:hypothetical protein
VEQRQDQSALRRRMDVDILPTNQDVISLAFVHYNAALFRESVGLNYYSHFFDIGVSILGGFCGTKHDSNAFDGYNYVCLEP